MVICEVCGDHVETCEDGTAGVIIKYYNLTPDYAEEYGFCEAHRPDDEEIKEVKKRIKQGLDPNPDDER